MKTLTGKEVLQAIIDGASLDDFEIVRKDGEAQPIHPAWSSPIHQFLAEDLRYVRKQKTHCVNGFVVPAPKKTIASEGKFWVAAPTIEAWAFVCPFYKCPNIFLERGLIFDTFEDAVANAKATVGIHPYK